jgi:hypothetical protein
VVSFPIQCHEARAAGSDCGHDANGNVGPLKDRPLLYVEFQISRNVASSKPSVLHMSAITAKPVDGVRQGLIQWRQNANQVFGG